MSKKISGESRMKTAKEWLEALVELIEDCDKKQISNESCKKKYKAFFEAVQLDAQYTALTNAAKLLLDGSFLHDNAPDARLARSAAQAILNHRDKQKKP